MLSPDLWREFAFDPRDPAYAAVRAGTADRNLVLQALAEAYADGIPLARQLILKQDIIAGHRRSIVKKHEKAQLKAAQRAQKQQPPELPPA